MMRYALTFTSAADSVECESCSYEAPVARFRMNPTRLNRERTAYYCELCASSFASNAHHYPDQYPDGNAMRTACHVGNAILDYLGKFKDVEHITLPPESEDEL